MKTILFNGTFFTGMELVTGRALLTEGGRITGFVDPAAVTEEAERIDCRGCLVTAGLIDLQIAGSGGFLFSSTPTPDALAAIASSIVESGTTGFLVALPTNSDDVYRNVFRTATGNSHPAFMGLHLEGPYISMAKRGAHARELIRKPSVEDLSGLLAEAGGSITMMTVAPEACTPEVIRLLKENGITVAAGHSNATFREAVAGFEMGIESTTHLFNAMSPLHHRDPGLPGAVFWSESARASIIADGIHVDYAMVAIAKKIMRERLLLVSDAVEVNEDGPYLHIRQSDRYTLPDGTLSGARLTMLEAVRNCINHAGIERYEALRMASLYPAKLIKADDRGAIITGARADLILLDDSLEIKALFLNGKMKFKN